MQKFERDLLIGIAASMAAKNLADKVFTNDIPEDNKEIEIECYKKYNEAMREHGFYDSIYNNDLTHTENRILRKFMINIHQQLLENGDINVEGVIDMIDLHYQVCPNLKPYLLKIFDYVSIFQILDGNEGISKGIEVAMSFLYDCDATFNIKRKICGEDHKVVIKYEDSRWLLDCFIWCVEDRD